MEEYPDFEICKNELLKTGTKFQSFKLDAKLKSNISLKIKSKIQKILIISRSLNCSIGIVGGFVRDLLLGRQSEDVDFIVFKGNLQLLTEKIALEMDGKIGKMSNRTLTTQVRFPDDIVFEFNSTRKERYDYPSRTPIVEKASIVEDLQRRDFTVNALILFGDNYIDLFDGTADLQNKIIQTTREADIVFHEDYLRIFRAIRFACKLDFEICTDVKEGIIRNVRNLLDVPKERILQELKQSIKYSPTKAFRLMKELKILEVMFPEVRNNDLNLDVFYTKNSWNKIERKIEFLETENITSENLIIAAILSEVSIAGLNEITEEELIECVNRILNKYKFSNKEKTEILAYLLYRNSLIDLMDKEPSDFEIRKLLRDFKTLTGNVILLSRAELITRKKDLNLESLVQRIDNLMLREDLIYFEPKLNGYDIKRIFKVEGETIGSIKSKLIEAIMKEEISNTKDNCISYIREIDLDF